MCLVWKAYVEHSGLKHTQMQEIKVGGPDAGVGHTHIYHRYIYH
jgi:hypothetical protein